jgi:hypothetical protein
VVPPVNQAVNGENKSQPKYRERPVNSTQYNSINAMFTFRRKNAVPLLKTDHGKRSTMCKYKLIFFLSMVFLLSGCSLFHTSKSLIEIEQNENPMIWKEVYKIEVALWPLEKKVNKMDKDMDSIKDELAKTKLSSIQANKDIESLQAEIQQMKSEFIKKGNTAVELPIINNKKETQPTEQTNVVKVNKKADLGIQSVILHDIQYYKVSDTQDKVLVYVSAMNNPKLQMLVGKNPRIVLDFLNSRNIDKKKYEINTDGNFIKRIRIGSHKEPVQKVRVVFDMMPNKKYSVDQKFSKKENMYSFEINANQSVPNKQGSIK